MYFTSSLALSMSGAVRGMATPASTGMKPRPVGPAGAGKATKSSGRSLNAWARRDVWSKTIHASPDSNCSCMKEKLVEAGLVCSHSSRNFSHAVTAASEAKVRTTPSV